MGFEEIMAWLDRHHTIRKFGLVMLASAVGFFVSNQAEIMAAIPQTAYGFPVALVFQIALVPLIVALHNWLKYNTDTPYVGKKAKLKA